MGGEVEKLNHWLTLLANIGVLGGFIFLAVELQQNTQQLKLQSYQAWQAANNDINMALTNPEVAAIVSAGHGDPANLTKDNYIAYAHVHMSLMQMAQSTHHLYQQGAIDEELWIAEMNRAAGMLKGSEGVRQWWEAGGKTQLAPSFVEFIESVQSTAIGWSFEPGKGFVPIEQTQTE